jgi:hypothetical protein
MNTKIRVKIRARPGKDLPGYISPVQANPSIRASKSIRAEIRADAGNSNPRSLAPWSRLRRGPGAGTCVCAERRSGP